MPIFVSPSGHFYVGDPRRPEYLSGILRARFDRLQRLVAAMRLVVLRATVILFRCSLRTRLFSCDVALCILPERVRFFHEVALTPKRWATGGVLGVYGLVPFHKAALLVRAHRIRKTGD